MIPESAAALWEDSVLRAVLPAGLKLGMYTDSGSMTCAKYAGSLGFEEEDAAQLAKWEVDFLKHDNCHSIPQKEARLCSFPRTLLMQSTSKRLSCGRTEEREGTV